MVQPGKRRRRLPSLYFGVRLIFADRDVSAVKRRLDRTVEILLESSDHPAFSLHACEIDGRRGLYARDVYNRSAYRMKLVRLGLRFAEDPYAILTERRTFKCEDWGEFSPSFMIFGYVDENPQKVLRTKGAMLPITAIDLRVGHITPAQLHLLIESLNTIEAVSAADPGALIAALKEPKE